jgi:hypothetical protein
MTKIVTVLSMTALSFTLAACGSSTSPASPTSVAGVATGTNDGNPTSVKPDWASAAKHRSN